MASLALRSARPWRAMGMRDRPAGCANCASRLCGALCGSGRPPRGGRRRSFVGGNRAMLAAPRIGAARRRRRATAQQRATNTTLAATRRFGNFVFGANDSSGVRAEDECGRRPRRALDLRGHQKQAALKDQRY